MGEPEQFGPYGPVPAGPDQPAGRRRPRQATTAAVLLVVFGLLGLLAAVFLLSLLNDNASHGQSVEPVLYLLLYLQVALSLAEAASGVFVWPGRSWARTLALVVCGVNIVASATNLFSGAVVQACVGILVNIAIIRLLASYEVADWCR